jgi:hypothetical protein
MTHDETLDVFDAEATTSALLTLASAQAIMVELDRRDVRRGGVWLVTPSVWQRFDRPWGGADAPDSAQLVGSIYVRHGVPSAYEVVIDRVTLTPHGESCGWTPERLGDEALAFIDLRLYDCPRIEVTENPAYASSLVHAARG